VALLLEKRRTQRPGLPKPTKRRVRKKDKCRLKEHNEKYVEELLSSIPHISGVYVIGVGYKQTCSRVIEGRTFTYEEIRLADVLCLLKLRGDSDEIKSSLREELLKPVYTNRQLAINRYPFAKGDSKNSSSFVITRKGGLVEGCVSNLEEAVSFARELLDVSSKLYRITDYVIEEWYENRLLTQIQFFHPLLVNGVVDTSDRDWCHLIEKGGREDVKPKLDVQTGLALHEAKGGDPSTFYWPYKQLD